MLDVLDQGLALLVLELVLAPLGRDVDARAVEGGRDLAREERPVVARVVPGEAPLVAGVLPEGLHELDRLERFLAVEDDLLAGPVHFSAAEAPRERVGPRRCIAEGVAKRLANGMALLLELHADLAELVEGLGPRGLAHLVEPRLPVRALGPRVAVVQIPPALAFLGGLLGMGVVPTRVPSLPGGSS